LRQNHINGKGAAALLRGASAGGSLTVLHLDHNWIGNEGADLRNLLRGTDCPLEQLTLGANHMSPEALGELAEVAQENCVLRVLDLGPCPMEATIVKHLNKTRGARAIATAQALEWRALCESIAGDDPTLVEVSREFQGCSDHAVRQLADALRHNTCVKYLYLNGNLIADKGASALAEAITNHPALEVLTLDDNRITGKGGR